MGGTYPPVEIAAGKSGVDQKVWVCCKDMDLSPGERKSSLKFTGLEHGGALRVRATDAGIIDFHN